jgi:hypothetical protein
MIVYEMMMMKMEPRLSQTGMDGVDMHLTGESSRLVTHTLPAKQRTPPNSACGEMEFELGECESHYYDCQPPTP